jgi:hypothetical protein
MIEILDFKSFPYKEDLKTYGYISLGEFELPFVYQSRTDLRGGHFEATCKLRDKTFDIFIIQVGFYQQSALVLADLTNMPGDLLVDQEELFKLLKNELLRMVGSTTSSVPDGDLISKWLDGMNGVLTSTVTNNIIGNYYANIT